MSRAERVRDLVKDLVVDFDNRDYYFQIDVDRIMKHTTSQRVLFVAHRLMRDQYPFDSGVLGATMDVDELAKIYHVIPSQTVTQSRV